MSLKEVILEPAKELLTQIGSFVGVILGVLVIVFAGWLVARIIKTLVTKVAKMVKLDEISAKAGLDELLKKGGIRYSLADLLGVICYWLILLITFVIAINASGLEIAADLLNQVVLYVPNIIAAIFILIFGMFLAAVLKNIINTVANNAGISQAGLIGKFVESAIVILTLLMALQQLGIETRVIEMIINIALASVGLGVAIAIGLGCKDSIGKSVSDFLDGLKKK